MLCGGDGGDGLLGVLAGLIVFVRRFGVIVLGMCRMVSVSFLAGVVDQGCCALIRENTRSCC